MAYNHFNNDLPVPPHGYTDWRAFYADSLAAFAKLGDHIEPQHGSIAVPVGGDRLTEIPYWEIAHYAAREQAEEDRKRPVVSASQLMQLAYSRVGPIDEAARQWLEEEIKKAIEREDKKRR